MCVKLCGVFLVVYYNILVLLLIYYNLLRTFLYYTAFIFIKVYMMLTAGYLDRVLLIIMF